ncbi:hypothetical protein RB2083_1600 [Rhodobacteraceae bacterium HTCC2083]|nr:hypothetical protein RB2083_1600 [Rhodobacteraceae bacterium HTCC2083]
MTKGQMASIPNAMIFGIVVPLVLGLANVPALRCFIPT